MRLPRRVRGILLGLATIVLGPLVAVGAMAPVAARAPATHRLQAVAVLAGAHLRARIPELMERQPDPTPTPTPAPAPAPKRVPPPAVNYPPGTVQALIMAAAATYGVDGNWMIRIGECESGLRPNAVSGNGLYFGIFQFLPSTFAAHGGTNVFDPVQQANITANMLAHGGARSWPVCSLR